MSQTAKEGVALLCGLAVLYGLTLGCIGASETPGERMRLFLMQWSIPLSILTIWLAASLLKRLSGNRSSSSSSPNIGLQREPVFLAIRCKPLLCGLTHLEAARW